MKTFLLMAAVILFILGAVAAWLRPTDINWALGCVSAGGACLAGSMLVP